MTAMTATQRARLRRKIADTGEKAFDDDALDDIWDEAGDDMDTSVLLCIEALLMDAAKFSDYTQNETTERKSQIRDNLEKNYKLLAQKRTGPQLKLVSVKEVPPTYKQRPG